DIPAFEWLGKVVSPLSSTAGIGGDDEAESGQGVGVLLALNNEHRVVLGAKQLGQPIGNLSPFRGTIRPAGAGPMRLIKLLVRRALHPQVRCAVAQSVDVFGGRVL